MHEIDFGGLHDSRRGVDWFLSMLAYTYLCVLLVTMVGNCLVKSA